MSANNEMNHPRCLVKSISKLAPELKIPEFKSSYFPMEMRIQFLIPSEPRFHSSNNQLSLVKKSSSIPLQYNMVNILTIFFF